MVKLLNIVFFLLTGFSVFSQDFRERYESIDVKKYEISISLNDSTNRISVIEKITIQFLKPITAFYLDLTDQTSDQEGMKITELKENDQDIQYIHSNSKITLSPVNCQVNEIRTFTLKYDGIPKDGLIISKNKFEDRTFFGDNWPNRAQNWIACVDHPSDKAAVSFLVEVPGHYKVVANGEMKYEVTLPGNRKQFQYESTVEIPTKVMVIGVAEFEVEVAGIVENIPVSSWVYPKDKVTGFGDLEQATEILKFFTHHFGSYPYAKLANVQSTTRFGGMENASCIFYDENSITGTRSDETLIVHEIAHQWFGNSATEIDWPHLWLSEGFATYCTNLYLEETYGKERLDQQMADDREKVLRFHTWNKTPVIDTISKNLIYLLNANSYQKGGWVLHMLRRKIGDDSFWKGMSLYYETFKFKNAASDDFMKVMEEVSGMDLKTFFQQWLQQSGHPEIEVEYKAKKGKIQVEIEQQQKSGIVFTFPLEIKIIYKDGSFEVKTVEIDEKEEMVEFEITSEVKEIVLDPNTNLLFEQVK